MKKQLIPIFMLLSVWLNAQSIQKGLQLMDMEQYSSAQQVFEQLLQGKNSAEHHYYMGYFYAKKEDIQNAKANFEKGLALDKKNFLNQVGLGEVKLMEGDKNAAKTIFEEAISKTKSKNHEVLYRIGEAYLAHKTNDPYEAVRVLEMAIKLKDATFETFTMLGDAYVATQKAENGAKASQNYSFAINRTENKNGKPLAKLAELRLLVPKPDYTDVLQEYKKAMNADPNYTPIYRKIAELYEKADKLDSSIVYYERYMQRSERSDEVKYKYARYLYLTNKNAKALEEFKALDGKVKYPEFYRWYAYTLQKAGMNAEAKTMLDKFMANNPQLTFSEDYECYANIAFATKNQEEAFSNLRKAAEKSKDVEKNVLFLERIADTLSNQEKYKEVADTYDEILKIYKGTKQRASYQLYAGYYRIFSKEYDKAAEGLSKAIELAPDQANPYLYYANNKVAQNNKDITEKAEALPYYTKYIEITDKYISKAKDKEKEANKYKDNRARAFLYMAKYQYAKKDLAKCKEFAQKVLDTKTTKTYVKEAEELLKQKSIK